MRITLTKGQILTLSSLYSFTYYTTKDAKTGCIIYSFDSSYIKHKIKEIE